MEPPKTPMSKKLSDCSADRLVISQFLEWMETHRDLEILEGEIHSEDLIMEYFKIDTVALENERRAILGYQREVIKAHWPKSYSPY